jgi:two-component system response regulator PilR (NtrC family)
MTSSASHRVLLIEDEAGLREVLALALEGAGFQVRAVGRLVEAQAALDLALPDAVVTDLRLKDGTGIDLLRTLKARAIAMPVVVMTAYATTEVTVEALNLGAVDFITKPFQHEELISTLQGLLAQAQAEHAAEELPASGDLIGVGGTMRKVQALVGKVARADTGVLITGESGTGKEVVARLIHRYSERAKGPFIAINCGALPEALLESELFGFEKGAFTGATAMKRGLFEEASGGILFLDEIGEMPLPLQVKLLRVIQERKVRRVGASEERPVDVRIIAATNRDLRTWAQEGKFREDLYYRLNILAIELPPLRERAEDLPLLAEYFLRRFCKKLGKGAMSLHPDTLEMLKAYRWPGNVRELENLMERCVALNPGGPITKDLLPEGLLEGGAPRAKAAAELAIPAEGFDLEAYLKALRGFFLRRALDEVGGVKTKAGKRLGMGFRAYRYWVAELGGLETLPGACPHPEDFPTSASEEE